MGLTQPANRIMIPGQRLAHASKAQAAHKSASPVRLEGETKPGRPCGPRTARDPDSAALRIYPELSPYGARADRSVG